MVECLKGELVITRVGVYYCIGNTHWRRRVHGPAFFGDTHFSTTDVRGEVVLY
jgi:hypothetical protein